MTASPVRVRRLPADPVLAVPARAGRARWLEARRTGLGGSDIAAILGSHPYASPLDVYLDKIGVPPALDAPAIVETQQIGHMLERPLCQHAAKVKGLRYAAGPGLLRSRAHPFALATLDALGVDAARDAVAVIEAKTGSDGPAWADGHAPIWHELQLRWYLAVTGLPYGYLVALLDGRPRRRVLLTFHRDPDDDTWLFETAAAFWEQVEARRPPAPTIGASVAGRLSKVPANVRVVEVGRDVARLVRDRQRVAGRVLQDTRRLRQLDDKLRLTAVGLDATDLTFAGEPLMTYRPYARTTIDRERLRLDFPDAYAATVTTGAARRLHFHGTETDAGEG